MSKAGHGLQHPAESRSQILRTGCLVSKCARGGKTAFMGVFSVHPLNRVYSKESIKSTKSILSKAIAPEKRPAGLTEDHMTAEFIPSEKRGCQSHGLEITPKEARSARLILRLRMEKSHAPLRTGDRCGRSLC